MKKGELEGYEKILIADDEEKCAGWWATFLKREGFQILKAVDGRAGLGTF